MKLSTKSGRRRGLAATSLGIGAALALAAPGTMAVGQESVPLSADVEVSAPVTKQSQGLRVSVPVDVICTGYQASVYVTLRQRVAAGGIAQGWGAAAVTCTGGLQTVVVQIQPENYSSSAFKNGQALVQATLYVYPEDFSTSVSDTDAEDVRITNR